MLFVILTLSGCTGTAGGSNISPGQQTSSGPFLSISTSSLSFGSVAIGKTKGLTVVLTNTGNSNVTVSNVTISGGQYTISGVSDGLILAPGQSATLDATFSPVANGTLTGSVTVASNATNSPALISLSGVGGQSAGPSVVLAWLPSTSSVAGYYVYRSQVSGGPYSRVNLGIVPADSYTDATVLPGTTYYYVITAVSHAGVESADSAQTSATIPAS